MPANWGGSLLSATLWRAYADEYDISAADFRRLRSMGVRAEAEASAAGLPVRYHFRIIRYYMAGLS
jgi:hypothetical protein